MADSNEPPTLGTFNEFEVYPMPMFATLSVADVAVVARWYGDALGFRTMFAGPAIGGALRRLAGRDQPGHARACTRPTRHLIHARLAWPRSAFRAGHALACPVRRGQSASGAAHQVFIHLGHSASVT